MAQLAGVLAGVVAAAGIIGTPLPVAMAEGAADVQLVLLVDVSRSVNGQEAGVERDGYVAAFRDPALWAAVEQGAEGAIVVAYVEWSSADRQRLVVPVTRVAGAEDAQRFADALAAAPVVAGQATSMSGALEFARHLFATLPQDGTRRVIDLSADGVNNAGPEIVPVRDALVAQGITINGLPIAIAAGGGDGFSSYGAGWLEQYFETCVIGGPDAFVMPLTSRESLSGAILNKLVREIAGVGVAASIVPADYALAPEACARPGSLPGR